MLTRGQKRLAFTPSSANLRQAAIFLTVYGRLQWGHRLLARSSQHVVLSSQTLADFVRSVPCPSNEVSLPPHGEECERTRDSNFAVQVENTLYGAGACQRNYARWATCSELHPQTYFANRCLLQFLRSQPQVYAAQPAPAEGPPMEEVPFASLKVHLHKPYWLVHAGDCEHFFVIEQIR